MLILPAKKVNQLLGYIKLHRQVIEWEWYKDLNTFKVFVHLLLIANTKDAKYMGQTIKRGSKAIKESDLGEEIGLTRQEVRTAIGKLIGSGEIIKKSTNKFTVLSVVNYEVYQGYKSDEQPTTNQQSTNEQPTINQQSTSIEEELKELKEFKELNNPPLSPKGECDAADSEAAEASNGESLAVETAAESGLDAETSEPASSKTRKRRSKIALTQSQLESFEKFWAVWPNKKSRGQAEVTWGNLNPSDIDLENILTGVERSRKYDSRFREGGRFIPHASTWLNAKGWLDEFNTAPSSDNPAVAQNRFVNFEQHDDWDFDEINRLEEAYIRDKLGDRNELPLGGVSI